MKVGAVQMSSGPDREANLLAAQSLVRRAAELGAEVVVLPEMVNCLGPGSLLRENAEPLDGLTATWASDLARALGVWLVAGSFIEARDDGTRANTSCTFDPSGTLVAVYRKVHLFDVTVPGAEYHESSVVDAGDEIVTAVIDGCPTGLSICYDLRFPELFRILALRGAAMVVLPAAFTAATGPAHWEPLLRARAIENGLYVVAAAQHGSSSERLHWHGHAMVIDPWGTVVAAAPGDGDAVVLADVDPGEVDRVRSIVPSLANRRPVAYRWPG